MLKYDYGKRIKVMINREIGLEKREVSISKLSHKYHENLGKRGFLPCKMRLCVCTNLLK